MILPVCFCKEQMANTKPFKSLLTPTVMSDITFNDEIVKCVEKERAACVCERCASVNTRSHQPLTSQQ